MKHEKPSFFHRHQHSENILRLVLKDSSENHLARLDIDIASLPGTSMGKKWVPMVTDGTGVALFGWAGGLRSTSNPIAPMAEGETTPIILCYDAFVTSFRITAATAKSLNLPKFMQEEPTPPTPELARKKATAAKADASAEKTEAAAAAASTLTSTKKEALQLSPEKSKAKDADDASLQSDPVVSARTHQCVRFSTRMHPFTVP